MRPRANTKKRRLEAECDGFIQEVARRMFNGKCALTGRQGVAGHHLIGRQVKTLRHCPMNLLWLSQEAHDVFHGLYTDRNEWVWDKFGLDVASCEYDRIFTLLSSVPKLEGHFEFWKEHRFNREPGLVWECDLIEKRDELQELLKGM